MSTQLSRTEAEIESLAAEELLLWAYREFGEQLCLSCSWQKQSSVLVHMVSELGLDVDVVELDTHLFFKETYETRERLVERYGLDLIRPEILTIGEQRFRLTSAARGRSRCVRGPAALVARARARRAGPSCGDRIRRAARCRA